MILTSNSQDQSELVKSFTDHYKTKHPDLSRHTFLPLVVNNEAKSVQNLRKRRKPVGGLFATKQVSKKKKTPENGDSNSDK